MFLLHYSDSYGQFHMCWRELDFNFLDDDSTETIVQPYWESISLFGDYFVIGG